MAGKIRVGWTPQVDRRGIDDGYLMSGTEVTAVWASGYKPRMPSDGSCGCRREVRNARNCLLLCEKHAADPDIVDFCLKPPRTSADPGLTP